MDIKSKLKLYTKPAPKNDAPDFDAAQIGCDTVETEFGRITRREERFDFASEYFGNIYKAPSIAAICRLSKWAEVLPEEMLFFDLETTSLSIASGSLPFLIGLAFFDGDSFVTEQIFLENPSHEKAALNYMLDYFNRSKCVVTFNGASFDVPLIKNRYMINRVYGFPVKIPVYDLILPARRIFRNIYESLSLQSLEKNLLGFERVGDIPGFLIPDVYFSFQRSGIPKDIAGVIEHNRLDLISMIFLFSYFADVYTALESREFPSLENTNLSSIASHLFKTDIALFLDLCEFMQPKIDEENSIFEKFSIALKRANEWEKAAEYWEKSGSLFSINELAKYHEHRTKNIFSAMQCCEKAKEVLSKNPNPWWSAIFEKRTERLARKEREKRNKNL